MAKTARPTESDDDKPQSADGWLDEVDSALKREKVWREKAKKVIKRYRDERTATKGIDSRVNILWSNTEVLKSALYVATAKPDIRRRFPDTPETTVLSRTVAEVAERAVAYAIDVEDVDDPLEAALEDTLLPGRGQCWVSYEPTIGKDSYGAENITGQVLCLEYVYWEDFCHGKARTWKEVPWVGRRHGMDKEKFETKFPDARPIPNHDYKLNDGDNDGDEIEVWEIWEKSDHRRLYVARGYADVLQADDDPYGLKGFFPCPKPLLAVTTTDKLTPQPEFLQYQDQANELDRVSTRISRLTEQLKWKGIYDASIDAGENVLANLSAADDGDFLPYQNWMHLKDKGGIEAGVGFWPMERIIGVLKELYVQKAQLIQTIYDVTGISDIVRGSTDPRETKGAQQLKAQFGSMRMQSRQGDVQRFIRDCYRIMAEIIAEHFTVETLKEITGMQLAEPEQAMSALPAPMGAPPPPPPGPPMPGQIPGPAPQPPAGMMEAMPPQMGQGGPPMAPMAPGGEGNGSELPAQVTEASPTSQPVKKPTWDQVMEILRSDKLRSYRIDVETDQTALQDSEAEKGARIEFMSAVNAILEKAYMAATTAPMMLPLIRETFMFAIRSFKTGRVMEQAAEDAFDQLTRQPPRAPPDPDAGAGDAEKAKLTFQAEESKAKIGLETKKSDIDAADKAEWLRLERDKFEFDRNQTAMQAMAPAEVPMGPDPKAELERERFEHEKIVHAHEYALKVAAQNKQIMSEAEESLTDGASTPPSRAPLQELADGLAQMAQAIVQGQQITAQTIADGQAQQAEEFRTLAQVITAPKRIIRGRDGKAAGVETVSIN